MCIRWDTSIHHELIIANRNLSNRPPSSSSNSFIIGRLACVVTLVTYTCSTECTIEAMVHVIMPSFSIIYSNLSSVQLMPNTSINFVTLTLILSFPTKFQRISSIIPTASDRCAHYSQRIVHCILTCLGSKINVK